MIEEIISQSSVHYTTPPPVSYDTYDVRYLGKWTCHPERVV